MALSPMMMHYLQTKEKYKDHILFYRLGDFYEMFYDDAVKVSEMLDLTLTGRDCGLEKRAPMCGIPFHAADTYIAKLVAMGQKVAICEQLTPPGKKELVKRDVVKIVSAGTITNDELIDDKTNNFVSSVYYNGDAISISWADITTGEFFVREFTGDKLLSEFTDVLVRINPAEIISNKLAGDLFNDSQLVKNNFIPRFNYFTESEFNLMIAKETLKKHFSTQNLSHFAIEDKDACICACGGLISYLNETQKHNLSNINSIKLEQDGDYLMLDRTVIKNLELISNLRDNKRYGSLLWLLDKTKTSMGARMLKNWVLTPLNDKDKINNRLDAVDCLFNNTLIRQGLTDVLSGIRDVGRITGKLSNGNLNPRDCIALRKSLELLPNIKFQLNGLGSKLIRDIESDLFDFSNIVIELEKAFDEDELAKNKDGCFIKSGYNSELDELRLFRNNSKEVIANIENRERERTGIKNKNLKIGYNRVFGYYIELTNSVKHLAPYDYIRRQTITTGERFVTEELKDLESKIFNSEDKIQKIETELFNNIKSLLLENIEKLQLSSEALAKLDVIVTLSNVARQNDYCRPIISKQGSPLVIKEGRHPVVEAVSRQKFISNDCELDNLDNRTMIITGPNMAGKSTYMRQVALTVILAHVGSFVPCKSAEIPLIDKIFTRIGASDNLILDQSTFMVEMTETANILSNATPNSLLIVDEIGRGTSTFDGLSIAWAIVEYITEKLGAKMLFATHYHELTELEGKMEGVKNYKFTVKEMQGGIVFLRKLMRGGANRSFGIEVAQLAGVSKEVTDRAKEILRLLENKDFVKPSLEMEQSQKSLSETERIIKELDINSITPMQAFNILLDLQEKVKE